MRKEFFFKKKKKKKEKKKYKAAGIFARYSQKLLS
jgi:hypothetical protein